MPTYLGLQCNESRFVQKNHRQSCSLPSDIVNEDNTINRRALGGKVFGNQVI